MFYCHHRSVNSKNSQGFISLDLFIYYIFLAFIHLLRATLSSYCPQLEELSVRVSWVGAKYLVFYLSFRPKLGLNIYCFVPWLYCTFERNHRQKQIRFI